jgi:acetoacetate decarboxylase
MRENELLERAFAMPLTNPAYPPGPYRFVDREYLTITYRTDPAKLRTVVPEPLEYNEHERSLNTNSSACRIRRALATTRRLVK